MAGLFDEYQRDKREREWRERIKRQKETMGNAERVQKASDWKRIGNEKNKAGNFWEARDYYREAIIFVEDLVDARKKERNDLLVPLFCNLAHIHLQLGENKLAEEAAAKALDISAIPSNKVHASFSAKAHFRQGLARCELGRLEEACKDFAAAHQLQPESEEVTCHLTKLREQLAEEDRRRRTQEDKQKEHGEHYQQLVEKEQQASQLRLERRARAQQRQQMQEVFQKLAEGEMLYEEREREMEPVRMKEQETRRTLDLERNILKIIDTSKGLPATEDFDEFMTQKERRCKEQYGELEQKKKILDKKKREQQWKEDDEWKGQRDILRERLAAERLLAESGGACAGNVVMPTASARSAEVSRWCEQWLRELLLSASVERELSDLHCISTIAFKELVGDEAATGSTCVKALVTDILKLTGDAAVFKLDLTKPALHYFDYFLKLEWEIAIARQGDECYRTADELIQAAADRHDGKAPVSIVQHRLAAGTFKIREFCSEAEPSDGVWPLATKVKKHFDEHLGAELADLALQLQDNLKVHVQQLLNQWLHAYQQHWRL